MVHALRRAGQRLRSGGSLISIRPHETQLPLVSIITPSRRLPIARLPTPGFDDRQSAADAALERVVAEGRFALTGIRDRMARVSESESLAVLWATRPGLALTVAIAMATPPALRALLEALGLR